MNRLTNAGLAIGLTLASWTALANGGDAPLPEVSLRTELTGMPRGATQEIRVLTARLEPGEHSVFHTHRAPVTTYVLEGALTLDMLDAECPAVFVVPSPQPSSVFAPIESEPKSLGGDSAAAQGAPSPATGGSLDSLATTPAAPVPQSDEPRRPPIARPHPTNKRPPDRALQQLDLPTDRLRGHVQRGGRPRDAALARDDVEVQQVGVVQMTHQRTSAST